MSTRRPEHDRVAPRRTLGVWDAVALIVGIVVGVGIFRLPSLVASNVDSGGAFLALWVAGGLVSLVGALVYSELAATFPNAGGEYHFLTRAYGDSVGFLFAWARLAVMQTGSIALVAFVFGDFASELFPLGPYGTSIYAAAAIAVLTALNVLGSFQGKWTQILLTSLIVIGVMAAVIGGLSVTPGAEPSAPAAGATAIGAAMVFVLLTYGGWNEAAYLAGELRDVQRNVVRAFVTGIVVITAIYLLVNYTYLRVLGLEGIRGSQAVGADLLRASVGDLGAALFSVIIAIAALSTLNATIFTGARTNYALGRDFTLFGFLGRWRSTGETPANALLVQGAIALTLVLAGTTHARSGVETMVNYTAPVFWLFFLLSGASLFVLRWREPGVPRPFRVPLYPITPAVFSAACVYMLYSSLAFAGTGTALGLAILGLGAPILIFARRRTAIAPSSP